MSQNFKDRLARLEAKHGAPTPPPPPTPPAGTRMLQDDANRGRGKGALIGALLFVGLVIGGVLGFVWDDIAILFPAEGEGAQVTMLESAVLDRMSAEEIEQMNADPELKGKSTMQKLLLSH